MLLDFQGVEKKVEILEKKLALLDAKPELFETPGQNNGKNCVELSFGLMGRTHPGPTGPGGSDWSMIWPLKLSSSCLEI